MSTEVLETVGSYQFIDADGQEKMVATTVLRFQENAIKVTFFEHEGNKFALTTSGGYDNRHSQLIQILE